MTFIACVSREKKCRIGEHSKQDPMRVHIRMTNRSAANIASTQDWSTNPQYIDTAIREWQVKLGK